MKQLLLAIVIPAALLAGVALPAAAQTPATTQATAASPSQLVLDNATRILTTLEARRDEFNADRSKLHAFVADEFNQMFDRTYAARLVLGRHARGAPEAEVQKFADALGDSLMRRYGSSLLDFNSRLRVRIKAETPLRGGSMVKVDSEFLREAGAPVPVSYLMRQTAEGWKVFDVIVEGVSFVQTFRNQFDEPLSRKSIAQVAADLRDGQLQAGSN